MGGEGRFLVTLARAALGGLSGGLLTIPAAATVDEGWVIPLLTCPVMGAIIAYELSPAQEHERKATGDDMRIEAVPVISVRPSGGLVAGFAGRFRSNGTPSQRETAIGAVFTKGSAGTTSWSSITSAAVAARVTVSWTRATRVADSPCAATLTGALPISASREHPPSGAMGRSDPESHPVFE